MPKYSLSWFKKRTAAMNKLLGTQLSPTDIYREQHRLPDLVSQLANFGDPRSARGAAQRLTVAREFQSSRWSGFINASASADAIASTLNDPEKYRLSRDGTRLYEYLAPTPSHEGVWFRLDLRTGRRVELKGEPPASAETPTFKVVERGLRQTAVRARNFRARHNALENYNHGWI